MTKETQNAEMLRKLATNFRADSSLPVVTPIILSRFGFRHSTF
jgi:hypothetical protein